MIIGDDLPKRVTCNFPLIHDPRALSSALAVSTMLGVTCSLRRVSQRFKWAIDPVDRAREAERTFSTPYIRSPNNSAPLVLRFRTRDPRYRSSSGEQCIICFVPPRFIAVRSETARGRLRKSVFGTCFRVFFAGDRCTREGQD